MIPIDSLLQQAGMTRKIVRMNLEGISHEESLAQPKPGGNCMNWVLGHLLWVYDSLLPLLGQPRVAGDGELDHYVRGSSPIRQPSDALPLERLVAAWQTAADRVDSGISNLPPERLAEPSANSPSGNPNETVGSLLFTVMFHQAYHAGQLGILRRLAGRPGAVK
jgi:uncharacterized damage-inducible protein DinB